MKPQLHSALARNALGVEPAASSAAARARRPAMNCPVTLHQGVSATLMRRP